MTTLDLDTLERAARAAADDDCSYAEALAFEEKFSPQGCLDILAAHRALQERVGAAEKALRPFAAADLYQDMYPDEITVTCNVIGTRYQDELPVGAFRAARAYFAARTKAGEPHEQE